MSYLSHLECSFTGEHYDADQLIRLSKGGHPLLARYDLQKAAAELDRDELCHRPDTLWRYRELLPVRDPRFIVSLGEGAKPTLKLNQLGQDLGLKHLYLKMRGKTRPAVSKRWGYLWLLAGP